MQLSADANQDRAMFYLGNFGDEISYFKAVVMLEQSTKCLASNGAKGLSLETYDRAKPLPDTVFLLTEAED